MNMKSRLLRFSWAFGAILLVGSIAGYSWIGQLAKPVEAGQETDVAKAANKAGTGVVCHGNVDVEAGLLHLGPLQPGAVTEIICLESQKVRKGDVLLKVQDEPFLNKVAEAETGVKIAQSKLDQARQLVDQYHNGIKQQEQAVEVAKKDRDIAELTLKEAVRTRSIMTSYRTPTDAEIDGMRLKVEQAKAGVNNQEAKLDGVKKLKPDAIINEAELHVQKQKDQLAQAQEALNRCTLRAPQDGTVLRVLATVGTQFTAATTQPAINFAPSGGFIVRADVEQDYHNRVTIGALAVILDDAVAGQLWHGKVERMSDAFLPPRNNNATPDFLSSGNSRVREVIISITPTENMPKLGQKVRVNIGGAPAGR